MLAVWSRRFAFYNGFCFLCFWRLGERSGCGFDLPQTKNMAWEHIGCHTDIQKKIKNCMCTCIGAASTDGAGASQIHKGILHLHSKTAEAGWDCIVGLVFGSASPPISNVETEAVIESVPSEEACTSPMADLCKMKSTVTHKYFFIII